MKDDKFSVESEPALQNGECQPDPSEKCAAAVGKPARGTVGEIESVRDSIQAEPALPDHHDPRHFAQWLLWRKAKTTLAGNLAVTVLVAVLSGPAAVLGAFFIGYQGFGQHLYLIVFGPAVEELLKQSGMTYLLEKKPYRVFAAWQFIFAAVVAAVTFASIENLLYIHVYAQGQGVENIARLAAFRWAACLPLHVCCAIIASLGLIRSWRRQLRNSQPAELSPALPMFALAVIVHGAFNLAGILFFNRMF